MSGSGSICVSVRYSTAKKEMREILNANANVDKLLGSDTTRKEKEKEQDQR
jgi:hypothetical protein